MQCYFISFLFLLSVFSSNTGFSQLSPDSLSQSNNTNQQFAYHPFFTYGTYIPQNLNECIVILKHETEGRLDVFKELLEEEAEEKGLFWPDYRLRKSWDLEIGSNLAVYFYEKGIYSPHTMVSIILVALHRSINEKEVDEVTLIKFYKKKYQREEKLYLKALKKEFKEEKKLRKKIKKIKRKEKKIIEKERKKPTEMLEIENRIDSLEKQKKKGKFTNKEDEERAKEKNWKKVK